MSQKILTFFSKEPIFKNFFIFSLFFFILFLGMSLVSYWSFSEIYTVHSAQHFFSLERWNYLFSLKLVYNFVLYISYKISNLFSLYPMEVARVLFAINGFCLLLLMTLFVQKKSNSFNAVLAGLILMSSFIFLERAFRVRSDLLVSSLNLCSLFLASHWLQNKNNKRLGVVLFLFFVTLFVSLKSVYWILFSSFLLFHELKKYKFPKVEYLKMMSVFFSFFLLLSFYFRDPFFLMALKESVGYYFSDLKESFQFFQDKGFLALLSKFSYVGYFLKKSLLISSLIILKIGFLIYSLFIKKTRKWNLIDTSFVLLIFVFLMHPQQKPFFICALTPYFLIFFFTDPLWLKLVLQYSKKFRFLLLLGVYFYVGLFSTYRGYSFLKYNNNFLQKEIIHTLSSFFKERPLVKIYDPNYLLYDVKSYNWYIESEASEDKVFSDYLKRYNVDVIFSTVYVDFLKMFDWKDRNFKFTHIGHHIYYKSLVVDLKGKKKFYGKDLFLNLEEKDKKLFEESSRKYWYVFLDRHKSPVYREEVEDCKKELQRLKPRCLYTKEEILKGWIPSKEEQAYFIGVFYLEPVEGLRSGTFLNSLYKYDRYIRWPNFFVWFGNL